MTLLRTIARPMLASMFLYGGSMALRNASAMAPKVQPVADTLQKALPVQISASNVARINAATHITAGLGLATGRLPRLSALTLAATMPATTATGHQFWKESDPEARRNQTVHFLKNVAITGGLLMSTLDPEPHKRWIGARARRKVAKASGAVTDRVDELRR